MIKNISNVNKTRSLGLIIGTMALVLTGYIFVKWHSINPFPAGIGLTLIFIALIAPSVLYPLRWVMEKIGSWLGVGNTYLLLAIIYVLFFIPLGLIFRLTGKDTLKLKADTKGKTYWVTSLNQKDSSMKYQF